MDRQVVHSHWEHFEHGADIGVRGLAATKAGAFEQTALALTAVTTDPAGVNLRDVIDIRCQAPDDELLLAHWLNAVVSQMALRRMLFGRFEVQLDGRMRELHVHRKGATRALGPSHSDLPAALRDAGQPVLIGGSIGSSSYVLAGMEQSEALAFASACHGAGRAMSRHQALKTWSGRAVINELAQRGIIVRSPSSRGVAEEAPGAYKDVNAVVDAAERAGLARKVARLEPPVCIKG